MFDAKLETEKKTKLISLFVHFHFFYRSDDGFESDHTFNSVGLIRLMKLNQINRWFCFFRFRSEVITFWQRWIDAKFNQKLVYLNIPMS